MKNFRTFFKTRVGMIPQSELGGVATKHADDPAAAMASAMQSAFHKAPTPTPPPAPVDNSGGSLGSRISAGLSSMMGQ